MAELALRSLSLSHFRSHKRAAIDLDTRPVVLFGSNGSGKTNLLEAVSLFSPGRGLRRASAEDMARRPESLGWTVKGDLETPGRTRDIKMQSQGGAARQLWTDGKPSPQNTLASFCRVVWLVPAMDRLWIEGAEGRRRFLDRLALSFFPDHADAALAYEKAMRERNRLLKDQVRDAHWYKALEDQMAQSGAAMMVARDATLEKVRQAQENAETVFPSADLQMIHPDVELPRLAMDLVQMLAENRMRDLAAGRSLIGPHRVDMIGTYAAKGIAAKDCSTGEQKALLISLILSNARALRSEVGYAPLVLLDEVSAHLDVDRRRALYDEICALGSQAWMTGTEIDVFSDFGDRAQRFGVSESSEGSQISKF